MKFLVLGGTAWLGREIAGEAAARGHAVTCLARGKAGQFIDGVRSVIADRDHSDAYAEVSAEQWDAVVDVGRQPGHIRRAVTALQPMSAFFLFVSTGNVYASQRELNQDEDAELLPQLVSDMVGSTEDYGSGKVACEEAAVRGFGAERTMIARAGLIGGPGDLSGRSSYWPWRFAHPSNPKQTVLVPDDPDVPTGIIDVRDLAAWLVSCAETATSGVFNAAGRPLPLAEHLAVARSVAGHVGPVIAAPSTWLTDQQVQMWSGPRSLPLWIDDPDWYGMNARSTVRARAAGLHTRTLEETLTDTLSWERSRPEQGPHGAGLTDHEEQQLLALLSKPSH